MKLGIVINNLLTEKAMYTTTLIALNAVNMGHEVWYIELGKLSLSVENKIYARARTLPAHKYHSPKTFMHDMQSEMAIEKVLRLDTLDILWLRNDPAENINHDVWAQAAGINFGRIIMRHGVLVLNDPDGLSKAVNKMYLQYFPESVRPKAIISRDAADIKRFIKQQDGYAVLKPLAGSGGHNVFLINPSEKYNVNQIIEAIAHEGYIIAQEYLHEAVHGDTRLFLINGKPLYYKNRIAAVHRVRRNNDGDMRSNISAGAIGIKADVTPNMLAVIEKIRPHLVRDGMFFVGLDLVGNKLLEINVFSPGGLNECEKFENSKFCREIIYSLERKVAFIKQSGRQFNNKEMATF